MNLSNLLGKLGACSEAVDWSIAYGNDLESAWLGCHRGDWMLWLVGSLTTSLPWADDRKTILACALDCALTVQHLWPKCQATNINAAVKSLQNWINGIGSLEAAKTARDDLSCAVGNTTYSAANAVYAAVNTVYSAANSAYANNAAYAAYAAYAVYSSYDVATLQQCADIVQRHYPFNAVIIMHDKYMTAANDKNHIRQECETEQQRSESWRDRPSML